MLSIQSYIFQGKLENLQKLINADANLVNEKLGSTGDTPLHLAAFCGNVEIVKYLLSKNPDIYAQNANKTTALLNTVFIAVMPENQERISVFKEIITLILNYEKEVRKTFTLSKNTTLLIDTPRASSDITPLKLVTKITKHPELEKLLREYQVPEDLSDSFEETMSTSAASSDNESDVSISPPKSITTSSTAQINSLLDKTYSAQQRHPTKMPQAGVDAVAGTSSAAMTKEKKTIPPASRGVFSFMKSLFVSDENISPSEEKKPLLQSRSH